MSDDNSPSQFQPPSFRPPSMPSGTPAYGTPGFGAPSTEPTPVTVESTNPGRKRPTGKIIGAAVAALAIIAAGVFAITKISDNDSKGGAASSTEVGEKFTAALNDEDILGVVDLLLPGERETFRQPMLDAIENLKRIEVLDDSADAEKVAGLDIELADVEVVAQNPVAEDIATITITATNESSFDGQELPLGDLLVQEAFGGEKPQSSSSAAGEAVNWQITTVEKDGRWYASLFYSIAESVRRDSAESKTVPEAPIELKGSGSPDGAVDQMLRAIIGLDVPTIVGGLNPNEFEAFQRYAPIFVDRAENRADELGVKALLTETKYAVQGDGAHRSVTIEAFKLEVTADDADESATVALADGCLTVDSGDTQFDSCTDGGDIDKTLTDLGIDDNPSVKDLVTSVQNAFADFDGTGIAVDEVDGKWYVSPIGTTTDFFDAVLSALDKNEITDIIDRARTLVTDIGNGEVQLPSVGGQTTECSTSDTTDSGECTTDDTTDTGPDDTTGSGTSITPDGFRTDTEDFIEGDEVADQVGTQFADATCETPPDTDIGTIYTCSAFDPDGAEYTFEVRITTSSSFVIESVEPA